MRASVSNTWGPIGKDIFVSMKPSYSIVSPCSFYMNKLTEGVYGDTQSLTIVMANVSYLAPSVQ